MSEVTEFIAKHNAYRKFREWAEQYTTLEQVYDACQRGDWLLWLLIEAGMLTKEMAVEIACRCAEHVLHIWEERYPTDMRPREAIKAARAVAAADATAADAVSALRVAAAAAAAAASSAYEAAYDAVVEEYAAFAVADAAAAAAAAANAAAAIDAADAGALTTYATDAASTAATAGERRWQADMMRGLVSNPWRGQQ